MKKLKFSISVLALIASFSAFSDQNCQQELDEVTGQWVIVCR